MKETKLAVQKNSGLSRLILGTWNWSGSDWGRDALRDSEAFSMLDLALEAGINRVDTAPVYGPLEVECQLGRYPGRRELHISTKFGLSWPEPYRSAGVRTGGPGPRKSLEQSLTRLQVDRVQNFFLHHPPPGDISWEQLNDWEGEIEDLRAAGKITAFGLANAIPGVHPRCFQLPYQLLQAEYSALKRWAEGKIFSTPEAVETQIQVFSVLARGILGGNYSQSGEAGKTAKNLSYEALFASGDHRSRLRWFQEPQYSRILTKIEEIRPLAADYQLTPAGLFYAWVLNHKPGFAIIAGCSRLTQLQEIIRASSIRLSASEIQRIGTLFPDSGVL